MDRLNRLISLLEREPENLALRKDAIVEAIDHRQWEIARRLIDAGLVVRPDDAEFLAHSGACYLQAQVFAEAEVALAAAIEGGTGAPAVHYNLAYARFMQGRYAQALDGLDAPELKALPLSLILRARCLHHLGRRVEAIAACRDRISLVGPDAETNGVMSLLLHEQGDADAAREASRAALDENPEQLEALLTFALLQLDSQAYDAAVSSLDKLIKIYPQCGRGLLGRALAELGRGRLEVAKRDIKLAVEYMPEHIGTWHVLAWVCVMLGNLPEARSAFESALALDRNFAESHGGLAAVSAMQGHEDEARDGVKRALRLNPQSLGVQLAQLILLQRSGQPGAAQAVLDAVLARPVARGESLYRDLVAAQIERLRAKDHGPITYH